MNFVSQATFIMDQMLNIGTVSVWSRSWCTKIHEFCLNFSLLN